MSNFGGRILVIATMLLTCLPPGWLVYGRLGLIAILMIVRCSGKGETPVKMIEGVFVDERKRRQ